MRGWTLDVRPTDNKTIRRENGEKNTQLYLNTSFFILHSSFIIMHCLRILIVFWASTLVDEVCPIASKDKAMIKAKLIPLVFFSVSRLCDLSVLCVSASLWRPVHHAPRLCVPLATRASRSASLRPFGVTCIAVHG